MTTDPQASVTEVNLVAWYSEIDAYFIETENFSGVQNLVYIKVTRLNKYFKSLQENTLR